MAQEGDKHVIVTGANKGIGLAIVKQLASEEKDKCFVYLCSRDKV
jgi:NAD(P)-dependent dehydrogenase (short-subunit alcohol dehydrogenase family)